MRSLIILLYASSCLSFCQAQNSPIKLNKAALSLQTDQLVKEYMELGIFSGVVLIAQDGIPFYEKAFGLANREKNIPNTTQTKFVIGSMNKSFTRVVINQLVQEGKLKLTDKLVDHLNGFNQRDADKISIRHLLGHTSGFGDYHSPAYWDLPWKQRNIQGLLPLIQKLPLQFEPGTENEYSNAGYILLGAIIEKITGKTYAQNVTERIKKPLQINSLVVSDVKSIPDRAVGYLKTIDGYEDNEEFITEPRSDGGFYATASDIMKYYRSYFYENKLISAEMKQSDDFFQQIAPIYTQHGAGIPLAGGFNGANTIHLEVLADNISIVVFANMDEPVAEKIAIGILHSMRGKTPEKPSLPAKLNIYEAYTRHGIEYIKNNFEALTANFHNSDPKDLILNNLGYDLMSQGKLNDALILFKLNTELFPEIANCWDSFGEALLESGDKKAALVAYKKALSIRPNLPSAVKMVKELEGN